LIVPAFDVFDSNREETEIAFDASDDDIVERITLNPQTGEIIRRCSILVPDTDKDSKIVFSGDSRNKGDIFTLFGNINMKPGNCEKN